jgi:hemerythrin-like domain-containing protein
MRFNIFNQIHKALRALLYDTALTLQQSSFTNPEEAEAALTKVKNVLDIFDKHAEHEDNYVLPAIQQYEPSLVDAFEQEHVEDHELAERLRELIATLEKESAADAQLKKGHAILHSFIAFMNFNLAHMAKEETVLNERLWRYYSDAEIIAINHSIVASIPQEEMAFTSAWMMRGLNNSEITRWLKEVQKNAPEFVFSALFSIAEKELPHNRFRKVLEDLTEGEMVA